ncbi:MAG: methyltransferase domain-containing protein [Pleurocapsa sp. MO_192.B19]|nr:methyltransferase domain-containing protein [Pleurocapsa sp. MO_192.B19]
MNQIQLDEFKQEIAAIYDRRKDSYDRAGEENWHFKLACRLVECADIRSGQKVVDLATGTGMVAIEAAKQVGSSGQVIGIDISPGLLSVAQQKINAAKLNDIIKLKLADVETLDFAENSWERILCCSALPLFTDVPSDLRLWRSFLVPGGKLGLCVFADTAFVHGVVLQKVARRYGINIIMSDLTGTETKCRSLLQAAGYKNIQLTTEQYGSYINLESSASKTWDVSLQHPHCRPLLQLESQKLEQAKTEYKAELEALASDRGIWNDITTFFVIGEK